MVTPAAPRSTKIWLYSPSVYIPKEKILEALQKQITTTHIEEITDEYGFPTEKLFAYVRGENIPSAVLVGSTRINITYPGMERRCRMCQALDHAAGNCPQRKCYNCNKTGANARPGASAVELLDTQAATAKERVPKLAELAWREAKKQENTRQVLPSTPQEGAEMETDIEITPPVTTAPPPPCLEQSDLVDGPTTPKEVEEEDETTSSEESLRMELAGPKRRKNKQRGNRREMKYTTKGKKKARRSLSTGATRPNEQTAENYRKTK